ncbi:MAG: hypothetical protein ACR2PK_11365 [Acidimicrobiales bacterium]
MLFRQRKLTTPRAKPTGPNHQSGYPALNGASKETLDDIASWADHITVKPGERLVGLGGVNRWSYLVGDPDAVVIDNGEARSAGRALGLSDAIRTTPTVTSHEVVACQELDLLAIPPNRLSHLIEQVPGLATVAFDDVAPLADGPTPCQGLTETPSAHTSTQRRQISV